MLERWIRSTIERLPLSYRVLYRQFLLRVVDLESLSIQADIPRYLGQFGGVLLMLSFIHAVFVYAAMPAKPWFVEQYLIRTMMLVAGLITVVCWDATFPDRRDLMVLGVLPVRPMTILAAKVSATAGLLVLGVATLNAGSGVMAPLILGAMHHSIWGTAQAAFAYWFAMTAAAFFVYCAVLTLQGVLALLLPRGMFLRVSSWLQLAAFTLFLAAFFVGHSISELAALVSPANRFAVGWSPSLWFFAILNALKGTLPAELHWLAQRGWIALSAVVVGGIGSLALCYLRTMKKIVEQPDLSSGHTGWLGWIAGSGVRAAMVVFSVRSLLRSRQHRVVYAFYLGIVLAFGLSCLQEALSTPTLHAVTPGFLGKTVLMVSLAVIGLRAVASLPISLNANWVMRVTQFGRSVPYLSAGRMMTWLLAALPVLVGVAGLALLYRPREQAFEHVVVLVVVAWLVIELCLVGVTKAPFACSYLPGKSNVQARFWAFAIVMLPLARLWGIYERRLLQRPPEFARAAVVLAGIAMLLWLWNRRAAKTAVLEFEELEPAVVTTLNIGKPVRGVERDAIGGADICIDT